MGSAVGDRAPAQGIASTSQPPARLEAARFERQGGALKYVYIAGLEHSGSTLTDDLLSRRYGGIGLGEVGGFFSPPHMRRYLERWGTYADSKICSCGADWAQCEFWGALRPVWGLTADLPAIERYAALLHRVRGQYGDDALVFDSSKSLASLRLLLASQEALGLRRGELAIVLAIKDVRSFAASVIRKPGARRSVLAVARAFRWWRGANERFLAEIERAGVPSVPSLYEQLCKGPEEHAAHLAATIALPADRGAVASLAQSHIAIGNKDYLNYQRGTVRYDDRWFHDDLVQLVYLLMPGIRRFNRLIAERCAMPSRPSEHATP